MQGLHYILFSQTEEILFEGNLEDLICWCVEDSQEWLIQHLDQRDFYTTPEAPFVEVKFNDDILYVMDTEVSQDFLAQLPLANVEIEYQEIEDAEEIWN